MNPMHICIFEDKQVDNFYPLTLSHPVYNLVCGMKTLREKILWYFPDARYTLLCRKYLEETVKQNNPGIEVNSLVEDNYLFINGRILIDENFKELVGTGSSEQIFIKDNTLIAAKITAGTIDKIKSNITDSIDISLFEGIPGETVDTETVNYVWDLIRLNGSQLKQDFVRINAPGISEEARLFRGVNIINKDEIIIET